jgi:hypothetical protein
MMGLGKKGRKQKGYEGREHVLKNYNFNDFNERWVKLMLKVNKEQGSWNTRVYNSGIRFKEVA